MRKIKILAVGAIAAGALMIPSTSAFAYEVQPGDTLSQVARDHGTTVNRLVALNGIADPNLIFVGQNLKTPGGGAVKPAPGVKQHQEPPKQAPAKSSGSSSGSSSAAKNEIMRRESGGDPNAVNPSSGAVGLFQCLPTVHQCPAAGDAAGQSAWADRYVSERYGSWDAALSFWNANGYY